MENETLENQNETKTEESGNSSPPTNRGDLEISLMRQQMKEMQDLNKALIDRLDKRDETPREKVTGAQFLEDPMSKIEEMLDKKLAKAVAPLQEHFVRSTQRDAYNDIKDGMKTRFGAKFKEVEHIVDGIMKGSGNAINESNVLGAFAAARGSLELGILTSDNSRPTTGRDVPKTTEIPPNHVPSLPKTPGGKKEADVRQLTESEKFLARRMNLSEDKYRELQDAGEHSADGSARVTFNELNEIEERRKAEKK